MKQVTKHLKSLVIAGLLGGLMIDFNISAVADGVPESHVASPEIYKVLSESNGLRVILATWKPGQKDNMHSHPALAAYSLTNCSARFYKADGTTVDKQLKAGHGRAKGPTKRHAFQNIGKKVCQTLLVERLD